jgi:hypothetical protein
MESQGCACAATLCVLLALAGAAWAVSAALCMPPQRSPFVGHQGTSVGMIQSLHKGVLTMWVCNRVMRKVC